MKIMKDLEGKLRGANNEINDLEAEIERLKK